MLLLKKPPEMADVLGDGACPSIGPLTAKPDRVAAADARKRHNSFTPRDNAMDDFWSLVAMLSWMVDSKEYATNGIMAWYSHFVALLGQLLCVFSQRAALRSSSVKSFVPYQLSISRIKQTPTWGAGTMHPCFIRRSVAAVDFIYSRRQPKAVPRPVSVVFECIGSDTPIEVKPPAYDQTVVDLERRTETQQLPSLPLAEVQQQPTVRARVIGPRRGVLFRPPLHVVNKKKYPAWRRFQLVPKVPRKIIPFTLPNTAKISKAARYAQRRLAVAPDKFELVGRYWHSRYDRYAKKALIAYVRGNDPRKEGEIEAAPPARQQPLSQVATTAEDAKKATENNARPIAQQDSPTPGHFAQFARVEPPANAHLLSIVPEEEFPSITEVSNRTELVAASKEIGPSSRLLTPTGSSNHTQAESEKVEGRKRDNGIPDVFMTDCPDAVPQEATWTWQAQDGVANQINYPDSRIVGMHKGKGLVIYHNPFAGPVHRGPFSLTGAQFDEAFDVIVREGNAARRERQREEEFVVVQARKQNDDEHPIELSNVFASDAAWRIALKRDQEVKAALEELSPEVGPSRPVNPFDLPGLNDNGRKILLDVYGQRQETPPPPYAPAQQPPNPFMANAIPQPALYPPQQYPCEKPGVAQLLPPNPFQQAIPDPFNAHLMQQMIPAPAYSNPLGIMVPTQADPAMPAGFDPANPFAKVITDRMDWHPFTHAVQAAPSAPAAVYFPFQAVPGYAVAQNGFNLAQKVFPEQPATVFGQGLGPGPVQNQALGQQAYANRKQAIFGKADEGKDFHPFTGATLGYRTDKASALAAVHEMEEPGFKMPVNPFKWKGRSLIGTTRFMERIDEALESIIRVGREARRLRDVEREEPEYLDPNIDRARQFWQKKKEARAIEELGTETTSEHSKTAPRQRRYPGQGMGSELRAHIARECDAFGVDQMPRRAGGLRIPRAVRGGNPMEVTLTPSQAWGKAPPAMGNLRPGWERRGRSRPSSPRP